MADTDAADPPAREDLPLPDYDHLPLEGLTHRVRSLDAADLERVLQYERAHGNRLPVVVMLENRLEQLHDGAEPSGGSASSSGPDRPAPADSSPTVSPATSGPAINPPSHGVPTNPAQPRSTG